MQKDYGKELLGIMQKFHKLVNQTNLKGKLPQGEFMMLSMIEYHAEEARKCKSNLGISVTELSKLLKASKPATSKMLNNIEEKNYIQRVSDKKDRRVVYVFLTDTGIRILEEAKEEFQHLTNQVLDKLGEEDTIELIRIYDKLYHILNDVDDKYNKGN